MTDTLSATHELDCRGLSCPLPIIKTKKTMDGMSSGEVLKMVASDPGSVNDMAAWVSKTGNEILGQSDDGASFTFFIRKLG